MPRIFGITTFFLFLCGALSSGAVVQEDCEYALHLMLLQDASSSSYAYHQNLAQQIPEVFEELKQTHPDSDFALSSYVDIPVPPWGCSGYDYCFQEHTDFTTDTSVFSDAIVDIKWGWGLDMEEFTLTAMHHIAKGKLFPAVDFTPDERPFKKLIIVTANSYFHKAGDAVPPEEGNLETYNENLQQFCGDDFGCCLDGVDQLSGDPDRMYEIIPNNEDAELLCDPTGLVFEDYVSESSAFTELVGEDIMVLVLAADAQNLAQWQEGFYKTFESYGGLSTVVQISSDASNITDAIVEGIKNLEETVCMTTTHNRSSLYDKTFRHAYNSSSNYTAPSLTFRPRH